MPPLVSILIPAFNAEEYIGDAIRSAIEQTWQRREIIVIDDGSRDQTLSIARQFASDELAVYSQANQGAAATRNALLGHCQGDYIQWLDADDMLAPDKISKQMELLVREGTPRTLISSAFGRFRCRIDRAQFSPTTLWHDLTPAEWLTRKLEDNAFMQTATWLVSRELTEAAGLWDTRLLSDDDGEYFCRVLLASERVCFVPDAKVFYRASGAARLSHVGQSDKKLEALFLSMKLHIQYIRSFKESERIRAACLAFLQTWLICFYPQRLDLVEQAEDLAAQLGGHLEPPRLSWKYSWIQGLFGLQTAKLTQLVYNEFKSSVLNYWDAALFRLKI